ncbi:MAG: hypothetical protein ACYCWE_18130 [Eubacteriales bacterium]
MNINNRIFNTLAIIMSVFFGIIIGVLFVFGQIPFITTGLWIEFGLAVLVLIILVSGLFTAALHNRNCLPLCFQRSASSLLSGITGTIITAIIALSVDLNPLSILDIILVSVVSVFFSYTLFNLIFLLFCIKTALYIKSVR